MSNEIKTYEYFIDKMKELLKKYNDDNIITIRDRDTRDEIIKLINEIEDYIEVIEEDKLYDYKKHFVSLISEMQKEIDLFRYNEKPVKIDTKMYNERAYSKLNYLFRKNKSLNDNEIDEMKNDYNGLFEKYEIFLEIINWLNDNGFNIIPEKTLFSAYLGISVDTYNDILKNASNNQIRSLFKNIDEYITTNQFGALINNDRKALERIQKIETYGQEMKVTQPDNLIVHNNTKLSYNDIMIKLQEKRSNVVDNIIDVYPKEIENKKKG